jgi:hypothetical protein
VSSRKSYMGSCQDCMYYSQNGNAEMGVCEFTVPANIAKAF